MRCNTSASCTGEVGALVIPFREVAVIASPSKPRLICAADAVRRTGLVSVVVSGTFAVSCQCRQNGIAPLGMCWSSQKVFPCVSDGLLCRRGCGNRATFVALVGETMGVIGTERTCPLTFLFSGLVESPTQMENQERRHSTDKM